MRNPHGYGIERGPSGKVVREVESVLCFHCQKVSWIRPFQDPATLGGVCKICMRLICSRCVTRAEAASPGRGCDPFEEKMTRRESRERFLRSAGILEVG